MNGAAFISLRRLSTKAPPLASPISATLRKSPFRPTLQSHVPRLLPLTRPHRPRLPAEMLRLNKQPLQDHQWRRRNHHQTETDPPRDWVYYFEQIGASGFTLLFVMLYSFVRCIDYPEDYCPKCAPNYETRIAWCGDCRFCWPQAIFPLCPKHKEETKKKRAGNQGWMSKGADMLQ